MGIDSPKVQIVLPDINPIDGDLSEVNVAVSNVRYKSRGVIIGHYTSSILGIDDDTVRKLGRVSLTFQKDQFNTYHNIC